MNKNEALKLALSTLDEVRSETFRLLRNGQKLYAEEKVWNTINAIKEALAQPKPDLTEQQRESYQKGHNAGVAHHKQAVKAAQPEQETVATLLLQSKQTYERNFGPSAAADWIYSDLLELLDTTPPKREWVGLTDEPEQGENTKQRVLQLIKELRPAIRPMEALGKPMTTQEWFDVLVKNIEVMI